MSEHVEPKPKTVKIPGPDHPISVERNASRVVVTVAGRIVADTGKALTLCEAHYPPVQYIPRKDVDMTLLSPTARATYCPYKGECSYFSIPTGGERFGVEAEPVGQHLGGVLAEERRRFDFGRDAVEAHRPGRHRHLALAMGHRLQDAARPEARLVDQIHRVEDGTGRDADPAQLRHRLVLGALHGPAGDHLVDFRLAFQAGVRGVVARVADQLLAPDQL